MNRLDKDFCTDICFKKIVATNQPAYKASSSNKLTMKEFLGAVELCYEEDTEP